MVLLKCGVSKNFLPATPAHERNEQERQQAATSKKKKEGQSITVKLID